MKRSLVWWLPLGLLAGYLVFGGSPIGAQQPAGEPPGGESTAEDSSMQEPLRITVPTGVPEGPPVQVIIEAGNDNDAVGTVLTLVEIFLAFLALVLAGGVALGIIEYGRVKAARLGAEKAAQEANESKQNAEGAEAAAQQAALRIEESARRFDDMASTMETTVQRLGQGSRADRLSDELQRLKAEQRADEASRVHLVDGQKAGAAKFEEVADLDTILVVQDALGLGLRSDPKATSRAFAELGEIWRGVGRYARSRRRLRRALEIDKNNVEARIQLVKSLAYEVAPEIDVDSGDLREAVDLLDEALSLQSATDAPPHRWEILHEKAWITDEIGDSDQAVQLYLQARKALAEAPLSEENPERVRNVTYNLACALTKLGRLDEALNELETVLEYDENWRHAREDPELEPLREGRCQERFFRLLDEAEKQSGE